ncbi:MAG: tryptophan--tRNA ligase [Candidatus Gracilibacteria bacterium]|nr:tryptophan--tRNA ligase [Candidatus Gracilibacteria bacterium]
MKRILTGLKPTGNGIHIGNYMGAVKPFLDLIKGQEAFLFIADFHSLTSVHNGETLKKYKLEMILEYMAMVGDLDNVTIFEQSKVRRINDITWILSSLTPYSMMLRAHSFKDSQAKNAEINMATFNYPILMASDIISYDADIVPVGKDQIQHLEFARDIAGYFNKNYICDTFKLPNCHIDKELQTIPGIDGRKMSKSYNNFIPVFASEKEIKKSIMSIVTDDTPLELPKNPDTCNVFALIKLFATQDRQNQIRQKYLAGNYGYGHAKLELLEIILDYFGHIRQRKAELEKNLDFVYDKLAKGNKIANEIVDKKYEEILKVVGL